MATQDLTTKNTEGTKKGTQSALKGFAVACSARPHSPRARSQPGPTSRRTRGGSTSNPGRVDFGPGAGEGAGWGARSDGPRPRGPDGGPGRRGRRPSERATEARAATGPQGALHFYPPRVGLEVGPDGPRTRGGSTSGPGRRLGAGALAVDCTLRSLFLSKPPPATSGGRKNSCKKCLTPWGVKVLIYA